MMGQTVDPNVRKLNKRWSFADDLGFNCVAQGMLTRRILDEGVLNQALNQDTAGCGQLTQDH